MAITEAQASVSGDTFGTAGQPIVLGSNVTTGNILVLVFVWAASVARTLTSVTDTQSNTWTLGTVSTRAANNYAQVAAQMCYTVATASNANTVTPALDGGAAGREVLYELTPGAFDQLTGGTGSSIAPSAGTLAGVPAGSFGIAGVCLDDGIGAGSAFTGGSGWTLDLNDGGGSAEFGGESKAASGSVTGDFSIGAPGGPWSASVITFKPVVAPSDTLWASSVM